MGPTAGRFVKFVGEAVILATIFFVLTVLVTGYLVADWPDELAPLIEAGDFMKRNLGPAWWALVIGLGAVSGTAIARAGKQAVAKAPQRWIGYR